MRLLLFVCVISAGLVMAAEPNHTGVEQEAGSLNIKALSAGEIDGLLNGEGMGMAKVMELNHYPGPRHLLDLSDSLKLTNDQIAQAQAAFDSMHVEAVQLGSQIIRLEAQLDSLVASGTVNAGSFEDVRKITMEIAALRGRLRLTHMRAHVKMRAILTDAQIAAYDRLRGHPTL